MLNKIFALFFILIFSIDSIGQNKNTYSKFPDLDDEKYFFELLFNGNGSYNNPFALMKVEVLEKPLFFISSKGSFREFLKIKFNITDSVADLKEKDFFINGDKFSLADTVYFYQHLNTPKISFYSDTILNRYRRLDLVNFLNLYCALPSSAISIPVIAYMFEMRMFLELNFERIGAATEVLLRKKYNIFWDPKIMAWTSETLH